MGTVEAWSAKGVVMVSIAHREHGIEIIGDEERPGDGTFICDDDFAFLISKMVERMDNKIKGEVEDFG